jgi:two-component system vancomycin resistance associated response regulator VraR
MPGILIADDNPNIRHLLRTFIQTQTGLKVCGEAGTGRNAIEKAEQLRPDIVILDMAMPELNGIEAASVLKRSLPDIRLVLFTMTVDGLGRTLATALGIDFVLSKEQSIHKLAEYLRSLVPVVSAQTSPVA